MKEQFSWKDYIGWIVAGLLLLGLVVAIVFSVKNKKSADIEREKVAALQEEIDGLQWSLENMQGGEQTAATTGVKVYAFSKEMHTQDNVTAADIKVVTLDTESLPVGYYEVAKDTNNNYIDGVFPAELNDMSLAHDVPKGAVITSDMLLSYDIEWDMRTYDVICDRTPIGFGKGDLVDVKVACPNGQLYTVVPKKQVYSVNGQVITIIVTEKDMVALEALEADRCRFWKTAEIGKAFRVYCVKYIDGTQTRANEFYPIPRTLPDGVTEEGSVLWTAMYDKGLGERDLSDWLEVDRATFEKSLELFDYYRTTTYTYSIEYRTTGKDGKQTVEKDTMALTEYEDLKKEFEFRHPGSQLIRADVVDEQIGYDKVHGTAFTADAKQYLDNIYTAGVAQYYELEAAAKAAKQAALKLAIEEFYKANPDGEWTDADTAKFEASYDPEVFEAEYNARKALEAVTEGTESTYQGTESTGSSEMHYIGY